MRFSTVILIYIVYKPTFMHICISKLFLINIQKYFLINILYDQIYIHICTVNTTLISEAIKCLLKWKNIKSETFELQKFSHWLIDIEFSKNLLFDTHMLYFWNKCSCFIVVFGWAVTLSIHLFNIFFKVSLVWGSNKG